MACADHSESISAQKSSVSNLKKDFCNSNEAVWGFKHFQNGQRKQFQIQVGGEAHDQINNVLNSANNIPA